MEGKQLRIALVVQGRSKLSWLMTQLFFQSWTVTMIDPNSLPKAGSDKEDYKFMPGEDWFDIIVVPQTIFRNGFQGKNRSRFAGKPVVEIVPPDEGNWQQSSEIIDRVLTAFQTRENSLLTDDTDPPKTQSD